MAFMMTRVQVEDYDAWKSELFDRDTPGVRATATGYRLFRGVEDTNDVFIQVEFPSGDDARAARERLLAAGVLERLAVLSGPTVVEEAESVTR
jgi:hypothetical protein